jgi:hypothetical protein
MMTSDDDEAEALLSHPSPEEQFANQPYAKQQLVRRVMANHGLTLAEALEDLREAGGL